MLFPAAVLGHPTPQRRRMQALHDLVAVEQLAHLRLRHKIYAYILARLGMLFGNALDTLGKERIDVIRMARRRCWTRATASVC